MLQSQNRSLQFGLIPVLKMPAWHTNCSIIAELNQLTMSNLHSTNRPGEAAEQQSPRANSFYCIETKRDINGSCIIEPDGSAAVVDAGNGIAYGTINPELARRREVLSEPIFAGRRPELYMNLMTNSFTWNPLDFFKLYGPG